MKGNELKRHYNVIRPIGSPPEPSHNKLFISATRTDQDSIPSSPFSKNPRSNKSHIPERMEIVSENKKARLANIRTPSDDYANVRVYSNSNRRINPKPRSNSLENMIGGYKRTTNNITQQDLSLDSSFGSTKSNLSNNDDDRFRGRNLGELTSGSRASSRIDGASVDDICRRVSFAPTIYRHNGSNNVRRRFALSRRNSESDSSGMDVVSLSNPKVPSSVQDSNNSRASFKLPPLGRKLF